MSCLIIISHILVVNMGIVVINCIRGANYFFHDCCHGISYLCYYFAACPAVSEVPHIPNVIKCSIDDRCLGIHCCVDVDFQIAQLMLKTWLVIDPCDFTFSIGFENLSFNLSLFEYEWGKTESERISDYLTVR